MTNINDPIPYDWKLGWNGMPDESYPKVNRLLKAVLEREIEEMDRLAEQGASLEKSDPDTLSRIIFHVIDSYPVMKWLVDHGVSRIEYRPNGYQNNGINEEQCISPTGYYWGLSGRAYYLKAYDVMDLLCAHGFVNFYCFESYGSSEWRMDEEDIFQNEDERAIRILLENGYCFSKYSREYDAYYEKYILNRPQVRRKTVGLDDNKFQLKIPSPDYEDVPLFWGKKEVERRNRRRREDYEDRLRAHSEFVDSFGKENMDRYVKKREEDDRVMSEVLKEMLESGEL